MKMKKVQRKIPSTMVTQHPDHASTPFWHTAPFIHASEETKECFLSFSELGASEYKWDWEGKLVDEAVIDRLLSEYQDYFTKHALGKEKFLTFRLPNPKVETEFRLGRAFMGIISAASLAQHLGHTHAPLFEVILPMTETAEEMIDVQVAFAQISNLSHPLLKHDVTGLKHIELIPLFEQVDIIASSDRILEKYVSLHKKEFKKTPVYLRPYLARSDPALNAGLIPTVLSIKVALNRLKKFEKKHNIPLFPILGAASLPFRGGLTPHHIREFATEYAGVRTTTIQSAFRYDYPKEDVQKALKQLDELLPKGEAQSIPAKDEKALLTIMKQLEKYYQETIEQIAPTVNRVAEFIPKRRERVQHVGLFGYSRGVGNVKLPRAIGFTASLYSIGVPPELIATGRGISYIKKHKWLPLLEKYYVYLRNNLVRSGAYLNKDNLAALAKESKGWKLISEDVTEIEKYLGVKLGPRTEKEKEHEKMTSTVFQLLQNNDPLSDYVEKAALLRNSLG